MSVQRRPNGRWQVRWYSGGKQRARTFRTKALARAFDGKIRDEAERQLVGARLARRRLTVAQWRDEWLTGAHNLAPSTRRIYREATDALMGDIGPVMLDQLDKAAIDKAIAAYARSQTRLGGPPAASSMHRSYRALRRMLRVAVAAELIDRNPLAAVAAPAVTKQPKRFLTAAELEHLAGVIDSRYRTLVLVAGWGGLRWGELAGLRHQDIDHQAGQVHVQGQLVNQRDAAPGQRWKPATKTGRQRRVDLPPSVMALLPAGGDGGYVWAHPHGAPLDPSRFHKRYWKPAVAAAGLAPLHPHNLRDTAVALAVAAGAHPAEIQAQLGHGSIKTTLDEYGGLFEGQTRQVAGRLDKLRAGARRLRAV